MSERRHVTYHPAARRQMDELWGYLSETGSAALADRYIRSILDHCDGLADFPRRGRLRDDIRPGLRTVGFRRRVVIAYSITGSSVQILGIFYGGRDDTWMAAEIDVE